jgi:hypothetical protein
MSMWQMILAAGAVFMADIFAVVAIVGSMWLERRVGINRRMVMDWIFVVAVSYGAAAWVVGTLMTRRFASNRAKNTSECADLRSATPPTRA